MHSSSWIGCDDLLLRGLKGSLSEEELDVLRHVRLLPGTRRRRGALIVAAAVEYLKAIRRPRVILLDRQNMRPICIIENKTLGAPKERGPKHHSHRDVPDQRLPKTTHREHS